MQDLQSDARLAAPYGRRPGTSIVAAGNKSALVNILRWTRKVARNETYDGNSGTKLTDRMIFWTTERSLTVLAYNKDYSENRRAIYERKEAIGLKVKESGVTNGKICIRTRLYSSLKLRPTSTGSAGIAQCRIGCQIAASVTHRRRDSDQHDYHLRRTSLRKRWLVPNTW